MEYLKISQVCWDPEIPMLFVRLPNISLNIFFRHSSFLGIGNKWVVWRCVGCIYKNRNPDLMMGKTKKPPIRNLERFLKMMIKNFPISPVSYTTDEDSYAWMVEERIKIKRGNH